MFANLCTQSSSPSELKSASLCWMTVISFPEVNSQVCVKCKYRPRRIAHLVVRPCPSPSLICLQVQDGKWSVLDCLETGRKTQSEQRWTLKQTEMNWSICGWKRPSPLMFTFGLLSSVPAAYRFRLWADRGWIFPVLMCLSSRCKMISPDPMARLHRSLTAFLCRSLSPVLNQKAHISPTQRTLYFMLASFWCCVLAYLSQISSFLICIALFTVQKQLYGKSSISQIVSPSVCHQVYLMWLSQRVNLFKDNMLHVD